MDLYSLITVVLCVVVVTTGTYLSVKTLVKSYAERKLWDQRVAHHQLITPLRLQAYERMTLFLERITPNSLVLRVAPTASTAAELHQQLLKDLREEFNHNLAQQIYIGSDTWEIIRNAKEEVATLINLSAQEVAADASVTDLARQIMKRVIEQENLAVSAALGALKKEVQTLF
jgi:hypothetical protein